MKESLFLCLLILTGCAMPIHNEEYQLSKDRDLELVNSTLAASAEKIKKKYDIAPSGFGVSMPGGPIRELTLAFDAKGPYKKEKLRNLLIRFADELVNQVASNKEMQQYLANPPFTTRDVQIIIYNHDKTGREVYEPEISTAELSQGVLTYRTTDPKQPLRFKDRIKETYEEALKALSDS